MKIKKSKHFLLSIAFLFAILTLLIGSSPVFAADVIPVISGVSDGGIYNTDKVITFSDGTNGTGIASATLNGVNISSNYQVNKEGQYSLVVTNKAGISTYADFIIDKTAPSVISEVYDGKAYNTNKNIVFSDGTLGSGIKTATLNGNAITNCYSVSAEGNYTLILTDNAGNTNTINFMIERTSPTITGVVNNTIYNTNQTISFADGTNGSGIDTAKLDGLNINNNQQINTDGQHTLIVTDKAGNSAAVSFMIDKTAPKVIGVTDGITYNTSRVLRYSDGFNGSGIASAKLNGVDIANNYLVSALGQYTLVLTDKAGNTATIKFSVADNIPPVITNFTGVYQNTDGYGSADWEWYKLSASGTDNGSPFSGGIENTIVKTGTGTDVDNYFEIYTDGTTTYSPTPGVYRVYLKDNAGNISNNYLLVKWTGGWESLKPVSDNASPTISISAPSKTEAKDGDAVTYTVTYADDLGINTIALSSSDIQINTTGTVVGSVYSVTGTGNTRIVTVKVESGAGSMGITIAAGTAYDYADKETASATSTNFTADNVTLPLAIESVNIHSNNTPETAYANVGQTITLNLTTNQDLPTAPTITVFGDAATVSGSGRNWTGEYIIKSSAPEGKVPFQVDCKDESGNIAATLVNTTDGTKVMLDKTGPTYSGVTNNGIYSASATISSFTDAISGILSAQISENGVLRNISSGEVLTNEGNYILTLTDVVGNVTTVNFCIDRTKPVITNFTSDYAGSDGNSDMYWEWYKLSATGTDDRSGCAGGTENTIVRTETGTDISNYFEKVDNGDCTPEPGVYRVYIKDRAGNISDNSLFVNWTGDFGSLKPVSDNASPTISISAPSKTQAKAGDTISYIVTYTDDLGIDTITLVPSDININVTGTVTGAVYSVEGTGNTRTVIVKVESGVGSMGITIAAGTAHDYADKETASATSTNFTVDSDILPTEIQSVSIHSDNPENTSYAKVGQKITLSLTTNQDLSTAPIMTVLGNSAIVNGSGKNWTGDYTIKASDPEGKVSFQVDCKDQAGNTTATVISTTDSTNVIIDKTAPTYSGVTNNGIYNTSDIILSFADVVSEVYSARLSENGVVRDIFSGEVLTNEGNYLLTLTDVVGNVTTVSFVIDRTKPVITNFTKKFVDSGQNDWGDYYDDYVLVATGTDDRTGFAGEEISTVIKTDAGADVNNLFEKITAFDDGSVYYTPTPGKYRVYIKDKAGNISDNYLLVNWTGDFASLVPTT